MAVREKQTEKILRYMKEHGSITPMEALRHIRCFRLGARIFDLRAEGIEIKKSMESHKDEDGNVVRYARYSL